MAKKTKQRHNSVGISTLQKQEKMYNIYAGKAYPTSPVYYTATGVKRKRSKGEFEPKEDASFETMSKAQNEYSPMLPSIHGHTPHGKPNFLKQNMSIANQVIRSYRSFSRRHAYNTRFEITEPSDDQTDTHTYDQAKDSASTKAASSPKMRKHLRSRSQVSTKQSHLPERVIQVKPIDGKQMLESIQETKESEQKLIAMKNRVEKLLKEKRKALSNIRLAKNRNVFLKRVNNGKARDMNDKQQYREIMQQKLIEQRELCAKQRRETKEGIFESKKAKVMENRDKKNQEKNVKSEKKKQAEEHNSMIQSRVNQLKSSVISHRKQKSQKFDNLSNLKNDVSQIRYHLKNEKLSSTRELHKQEIEELMSKEKEILEKLKHTLERQEEIEREANSPIKFRRAPSLNMEAKFALFQNKFTDKNIIKNKIKGNESFWSYVSKDSCEKEKSVKDSELNKDEE